MDLRIIISQEGDYWSAQCVDYDIGTQGSSIAEVQQRFESQLIAEAMFSVEATGKLFGGIPAAPKHFEDMWNECDAGSRLSNSRTLAATQGAEVNINMQLCA